MEYTKHQQQAIRIREAAKDAIAQIRSNTDLSVEGRQRAIAARYQAAQDHIAALQDQERAVEKADALKLQRELFGFTGTADPSAAISMRDAMDRASRLQDERDVMDLLNQAKIMGDTALAKAVLSRAVELAIVPAIQQYADDYPADTAKVQRLVDSSALTSGQQFASEIHASGAYYNPPPAELGQFSEYQIRDLAENAATPTHAAIQAELQEQLSLDPVHGGFKPSPLSNLVQHPTPAQLEAATAAAIAQTAA